MLKRFAAAAVASLFATSALAQDKPNLMLELNKLEQLTAPEGPSCRAYLVETDPKGGPNVEAVRLDMVVFGTDGGITRRVTLDLPAIRASRTQVRPFDLPGLQCDSIGQILINGTLICKIGGVDPNDCLDRIDTTSRTPAKLIK